MTITAAQEAMRAGRLEEARTHLEAVIRTTPTGPETYYNLAMVLTQLRDFKAAAESFEHCARFAPDNPDILNNLANALRLSGQLEKTEKVFDKALARNPRHPALRCNRGWLKLARGENASATSDFREALDANRGSEDAWLGLAQSLLAAGDTEQAGSVSRQALEKFPRSAALYNLLGVYHIRDKRPEDALRCFQESVKLLPENVDALTNLGITSEQLGELDLAKKCLLQALEVTPTHHPAWFHLANLANWQPAIRQVAALEKALEAVADDTARINLEFALAKALSKLNQHERAFPHFIAARRSMAARQHYDLEAAIAELEAAGLQPLKLESAPPKRLFVVGMPRSGTTLIDQIFAAHSDAHSRGDTGLPARLKNTLTQKPTPLGQWLRQQMPIPEGVQCVVETSPGHFSQVGQLASLLPEARFIHCLRHPLDTCVSIFEQPLTGAHAYANTLEGLGRYYQAYRTLMRRWQNLLGERLITVQYEQLVTHPEDEITRLLAHCELPLQQACLDFHQYQRAVSTPSASQVRQPINTRSVGRWRHYEPFLEPLYHVLSEDLLDHS